jgi:hypothetical protein
MKALYVRSMRTSLSVSWPGQAANRHSTDLPTGANAIRLCSSALVSATNLGLR